jgi:hypothetical protein
MVLDRSYQHFSNKQGCSRTNHLFSVPELLEEAGILLGTRNSKGLRFRSNGVHEIVIVDGGWTSFAANGGGVLEGDGFASWLKRC